MSDIIRIKTWSCSTCGYPQDFDPNNKEQWAREFPNIKQGLCPNPTCASRITGFITKLKLETDPTKQIIVTILTDVEIDNSPSIADGDKAVAKTQAGQNRTKFNSSEWKA